MAAAIAEEEVRLQVCVSRFSGYEPLDFFFSFVALESELPLVVCIIVGLFYRFSSVSESLDSSVTDGVALSRTGPSISFFLSDTPSLAIFLPPSFHLWGFTNISFYTLSYSTSYPSTLVH